MLLRSFYYLQVWKSGKDRSPIALVIKKQNALCFVQVLEEAQAEIRIIELYGTGEDRVAEEERFWYRMRGDALPPLPSEPTLSTARVIDESPPVLVFSLPLLIE